MDFIELSASIAAAVSIDVSLALANAPLGVSYYPPTIDTASNLLIAANNKRALTLTGLSASGLSLTLDDASTWPNSGALTLDYALAILRTPTSSEIVYYTSRTGNVLTIDSRAQGGTTAKVWPVGSSAEMRHTAEHHNLHSDCIVTLQTELNNLTATVDTKADVDDLASKLDIAGGAMTGALTLASSPTVDLHAATKRYVDEVGITVWNVKNYGVVGDGVTDDTAAINALHTLVFNAGGAKIFFPRGKYIIGGSLLDPEGANAQIPIPIVNQYEPTKCIEWVGEFAPPVTVTHQGTFDGDKYSVIKSTLDEASGTASLLGGVQGEGLGSTNGLLFNIRDMVFELPANPTFTCLDFTNQMGNRIERVLIYAGVIDVPTVVEPTHSNSYGAKLSPWNHSSRIDLDLIVFGMFTAVKSGELAWGKMIGQCCKVALEIPFANFATKFELVGVYNCAHGVTSTGDGICRVLIDLLSIESSAGFFQPWQDLEYAVHDPSNLLHGKYNWESVEAGVGMVHAIPTNGGTNFIGTELW
jgi:hypothetical protein